MNAAGRLPHTRSALGRLLRGTKNAGLRKQLREFAERRAERGDSAAQIFEGLREIGGKRRISEQDRTELLKGLERDLPAKTEEAGGELAKWRTPIPFKVTPENVRALNELEVSSAPRPDCWAQLARGGSAQVDCPDPREIRVEDIAHALARLCRFGGHVKPEVEIYSVAQHSLLVSEMCPPELKLVGLLHDAAEAYVGDVIRPVKMLLPSYKELERRWELAIGEAFGLGQAIAVPSESVKFADNRALATEKRDVLAYCPRAWVELPPPHPLAITAMGVRDAEREFLAVYHRLVSEMAAAPAPERPVYQVPDFPGRVRNTPYMLEVKKLPCAGPRPHKCQRDEDGMVQAAHTGLGKGLGTKTDDVLTVPLCAEAHRDSDSRTGAFEGFTKEERREYFARIVKRTQATILPILARRARAEGKAAS